MRLLLNAAHFTSLTNLEVVDLHQPVGEDHRGIGPGIGPGLQDWDARPLSLLSDLSNTDFFVVDCVLEITHKYKWEERQFL